MKRALLIGCLGLAALPLLLIGLVVVRYVLWPVQEVGVALPDGFGRARVQVWGDTMSEGRFELVVDTPSGSVRKVMWEDWGPAQRTSLYLTPEMRLVAIGGGGTAAIVSIAPGRPPAVPTWTESRGMASERWRYLGAVDRAGRDLQFFPPNVQRECNAEFGAGSVRYRRESVAPHFCGDLRPHH